MTIIAIPEILEQKLTHDGAEALVGLFNSFEDRTKNDVLKTSGDKFEIRLGDVKNEITQSEGRLEVKIAQSEARLEAKIAGLRTDFKEDSANVKTLIAQSEARLEVKIAGLRTDFKEDSANVKTLIAQSEARLIKWFVGAAIAQIAIILSVLSFVMK